MAAPKGKTQYTGFRMPTKLREKVTKIARDDRRSLSQMMEILLEEAVANRESAEEQKKTSPLLGERNPLTLNQ